MQKNARYFANDFDIDDVLKIVFWIHACMHVKSLQSSPTLCSPPDSSVHGDSPGKNTGMGWQFILHGIVLI